MKKAIIIVSILVISFIFIRLVTNWEAYFNKPVILDQKYCYLAFSDCAQRVPMFRDTSTLIKYYDILKENNSDLDDGVLLVKFRDKFMNPYELVNILSIDTLRNGIIYCSGFQNIELSRYKRKGYFFYDYCHSSELDSSFVLCDNYLDGSWQTIYGPSSSPNPYDDK